MQELDIVDRNIIKSIDLEIGKLKLGQNFDKDNCFKQFTRITQINYAKHGKYASDNFRLTKLGFVRKNRSSKEFRQGQVELSDFRKSYLDKLNRFLAILNEVSDFSSIGLLKVCKERNLRIHNHSDLTRHIGDLSDLGAVKITSVGNSPRKLEILKKSLIN
jgi:hypothetical protein